MRMESYERLVMSSVAVTLPLVRGCIKNLSLSCELSVSYHRARLTHLMSSHGTGTCLTCLPASVRIVAFLRPSFPPIL